MKKVRKEEIESVIRDLFEEYIESDSRYDVWDLNIKINSIYVRVQFYSECECGEQLWNMQKFAKALQAITLEKIILINTECERGEEDREEEDDEEVCALHDCHINFANKYKIIDVKNK